VTLFSTMDWFVCVSSLGLEEGEKFGGVGGGGGGGGS